VAKLARLATCFLLKKKAKGAWLDDSF